MPAPLRSLRWRSILSLPAGTKNRPIHIPGDVRRRLRHKYGNQFMTSIDPRDEMFRFLESHPGIDNPVEAYFESGESLHENLLYALKEATFYPGVSSALLDFACGYGRLARFLVKDVGPQNITVADIDARAVDFCKSRLGVTGFNSTRHPGELVHDGQYDGVLVVSLFSHLSLQLWSLWLERLFEMVKVGGVLLFSTHGLHAYGLLNEQARRVVEELSEGFYYVGVSETNRLSSMDYGTTYVSQTYVERAVRKARLGTREAYFPHLLWNFQDVYVLRKQ